MLPMKIQNAECERGAVDAATSVTDVVQVAIAACYSACGFGFGFGFGFNLALSGPFNFESQKLQ